MKTIKIIALNLLGLVLFPTLLVAETIGVFFNSSVEQIKFAAGDVKTALESKGHTVEMLALSSLDANYANKKVVIALAADVNVSTLFTNQGGAIPTGLGEQAYGLKTTTNPQKSFWVFGGDSNGAMYGGLQVAENIQTDNLAGTYDEKVSPDFLQRGAKLNLPFDYRIPTYSGYMNPTSAQLAIPHVWDINFWKTWLDIQARNRYNILSVWVHHPFPALVKVPKYPLAALPSIEGANGFKRTDLTIEKRIAFWKEVMNYAHSRGFSFYFFCWNVKVDYASTQYPQLGEEETNTETIKYLKASMKSLIETYPELDGFGISAGDNMSSPKDERPAWTWKAYGEAALEYAQANPDRKFTILHRGLGTSLSSVYKDWLPLTKLPNMKFDYSVKYANAHMFSTLTHQWYISDIRDASTNKQKTWLTLRNDDFFYMDMGDPKFVRDFLNSVPNRDVINSFYMGSDLYMPTKSFLCKDAAMNNQLEIQRNWYIQMLWGRISYNKNISDNIFKNEMTKRYPTVSSETLFNAWALAARPLPKVQELIQGNWTLDAHWYAEASLYPNNGGTNFRFLNDFITTEVAKTSSSNLCSISKTAAGTCSGAKSTYTLADEMEADALAALVLIKDVSSGGDANLQAKINNIKQLAYLSIHYAHKIRAATYKAANQTVKARESMGKAYCWWIKYSRSMFEMYNGNRFRTVEIAPDWKFADAWQLKDYTDLGGVGMPICGDVSFNVFVSSSDNAKGTVTGAGPYNSDDIVEVKATSKAGYRFVNWTENNVVVSTDLIYRFTADKDRTLIANFVESGGCELPWSKSDITVNSTTITNQSFGIVNTVCSSAITISVDVEGLGGLDPTDYCKITYKIDGGLPQSLVDINNLRGAFAKQTYSKTLTANSVELILNSLNTASDEIYKITNIKISAAPTAIENIDFSKSGNQSVNIYPNPAENELNIEFPTEDMNREIKLFNSLGQLIFQTKAENLKNKIDVSNFKGFVSVQVISGEKSKNLRVLVK